MKASNEHLSPGLEKYVSSSSNSGDDRSSNSGGGLKSPRCPVCNAAESDDDDNDVLWIQCDNERCASWYHVLCTDIDAQDCKRLDTLTWLCPKCHF